MKLEALSVCALLCVVSVQSAKILGFHHVPTRSHYSIASSILFELAAKGHDVTIASPYRTKGKLANVRDVILDKVIPIGDESRKTWMNTSNENVISTAIKLSNFTNSLADAAFRSADMLKLLQSGEKFDIVIVEPFGNFAHFGLANHFNAHLVVLTTGDNTLTVSSLAGCPSPLAFVPTGLTPLTDEMSFFERLLNGITYLSVEFYLRILVYPTQKQLYEEFFKNKPPFEEILYNASLYLVNSNAVFESPRPYLPNMIQIGGVHIKEPQKLPQDIQEYMDEAKEGVILFSLGSYLHSNELPAGKRDAIMKTLEKFPQKVLWKFEDENLPGKPDNIKISKWLPQNDILAHPNLRLFISHGGLLSSTESLYRGVPLLGIPFYGDQHANIGKFIKAGYGEKLAYDDLTEETFTAKLKQMLGDSKYKKNIKRDCEIAKDQLNKPLDRAVYWIEYVIRHDGAKHLRASSNKLSTIQYFFLDILAFIALLSSAIIYVLSFIIKKLCCKKTEHCKAMRKKPKRE